jgi:HK97 family phage portal protein
MRVFGWNIQFQKAPTPQPTTPLSPIYGDRGNWWFPIIREPYTGAWQKNVALRVDGIVTYFAVYSCLSLISTDIGKLGLQLMAETDGDLLIEASSPAFSPVLRKPNRYQTRNKFIESWMLSKLIHGNAYILKERDNRGVVVALYVLEPTRAKVLVAPDGSIYYEFAVDNLSGLFGPEAEPGVFFPIQVPASEVIHDVNTPLFHPLFGISPIMAASLPVMQGLAIQRHSAKFFEQGARPGGILTAPGTIPQQSLERIKNEWETRFSGDNAGRVAVLGDGLKYDPLGIPAEQAQLIEQLKWSAENVCSVFHVPPFMIGLGNPPSFDNVEALNQQYYSQCLQTHIESIEALLDEGLGLSDAGFHAEFCLEDLLRMDSKTKIQTTADAVKAGFLSPNEARAKFNLQPTEGGESPYLQQQNYNLAALAQRGAPPDPAAAPPPASPAPSPDPSQVNVDAARILELAAGF